MRGYFITGAVLSLLLVLAEFVFPNYVSRIVREIAQDAALVAQGENPRPTAEFPEGTALSNAFAFQLTPLHAAPSQRPAGVLGPDPGGQFTVIEQTATRIAGRDLAPILATLGATVPTERYGGIKQLIEVGDALFALLALQRGDCLFAALVDLDRGTVVDEFPCLPGPEDTLSMNGVGGGYVVMDGAALIMALGTGSDTAWSRASADAQDPASPYGKILRYDIALHAEGPRLSNRSILTSGHRNPQGMLRYGDMILAVEHGPRGGDEINLIEAGANYGWPLFSAGSQYNFGDLTSFAPEGSGFTNPLFTFVPSIAPSDLSQCPDLIARRYAPADCVIVASLRAEAIFIVLGDFANRRVRSVERVNVGMRVRRVFIHDGALFLLPDDAQLMRADITARPCQAGAGPCQQGQ